MGFYRQYPNRKDWRRDRAWVTSCRPVSGCTWCMSNKQHHLKKQLLGTYDEDVIDGRQIRPRRKHSKQ